MSKICEVSSGAARQVIAQALPNELDFDAELLLTMAIRRQICFKIDKIVANFPNREK